MAAMLFACRVRARILYALDPADGNVWTLLREKNAFLIIVYFMMLMPGALVSDVADDGWLTMLEGMIRATLHLLFLLLLFLLRFLLLLFLFDLLSSTTSPIPPPPPNPRPSTSLVSPLFHRHLRADVRAHLLHHRAHRRVSARALHPALQGLPVITR